MRIMNEMVFRSILAFGLIGMSQAALAEKRLLNADEVIAVFSGKTAWGQHVHKKKRSKVYFSPDGTRKGMRLDKDKTIQGTWSIDKKGRLCLKKWTCRRVYDVDGVIELYEGSNEHILTYTKFKDGNKL